MVSSPENKFTEAAAPNFQGGNEIQQTTQEEEEEANWMTRKFVAVLNSDRTGPRFWRLNRPELIGSTRMVLRLVNIELRIDFTPVTLQGREIPKRKFIRPPTISLL